MALGTLATIAALASLGLGAGSFLGGALKGRGQDPYMSVGDVSDVQNANPFTNRILAQTQSDIGNFNNLLMGQLGRGEGFQRQGAAALTDLMGYNPTVNYDPMAAQRMFLSVQPSLQRVAQQAVPQVDVSQYQGQLAEQVANQYQGNPNSGAFVRTLGETLLAPQLQADMARQQAVSQIFNALAGQSLSGLQQGNVAQGQFQQASNQQRGTAMAQGAQGLGDLAGQSFNNMGVFGSLLGNLQSQRAQFGGPEWWQPTYLNNPNFVGARDWMNFGSNMMGAGASLFPTEALGTEVELPSLLGGSGGPSSGPTLPGAGGGVPLTTTVPAFGM